MKAVGGRPSFWIGFWMGWVWVFGLAVCTLLALYGWRTYDDEGFMLYPSLQLLEGHSLYSEVFTLYGPVFHLANTGWVWLFGPSMLAARLATTGLAGLSAAFLYAIGRRFMPPLASMVPAMVWLLMASTNLNESLHPGWYSTALTLAAVHLWMRGPAPGSGGRLFGIGLLVGVLAGFKVNVAAFTGFGFAAFFLTACRCPRPLRWLAAAGFAGCLIFLMSADLWPPQRGVYPFLLVITVILFFFRRPSAGLQGSGLKALAWGAAGAAAGVLLWLIPTVRISGLGPAWDMMIVLAARQPRVFSNVGQGPFPSVAVLAALGLWAALQIRRTSWRPALALLVAAGCGAGVLLVAFPKLLMLLSEAGPRGLASEVVSALTLSLILVSVWTREAGLGRRVAAAFIGWQALFQVFQIYPDAGTQLVYATPLVVLLVGALAYALLDRRRMAEKNRRPFNLPVSRSIAELVFPAATLAFLLPFLGLGVIPLVKERQRGIPLSAPSAAGVRFQPETAPQLEALIRYLRRRTAPGDPIFTMPGMSSIYIWTGRPSVTRYNATTWGLLTPEMQESIVERLPRVRFLVVNRKSLFWKSTVQPTRLAGEGSTRLRDRVFRDYAPLPPRDWLGPGASDGDPEFEIWVRRKDAPAGPPPS